MFMSMDLSSKLSETKILSLTLAEAQKLIRHLLEHIAKLEAQNAKQEKRIIDLEIRLNKNSTNSDKPSSTDSPYKTKPRTSQNRKPKQPRNREGHSRKRLEPTHTQHILPGVCSCGSTNHSGLTQYHTHQVVELPEINLIVEDIVLHKRKCAECGKVTKGEIPQEKRTGYGPRLSAMIVELLGVHGDSRRGVQDFLASVLGISVSQGAIQKIVNRFTEALESHYQAIREAAHREPVNYIDETSWKTNGELKWLWAMTNTIVSFIMIHKHRSRAAFEELIGAWEGILVSDGYAVYRKWVHGRQSCLVHMKRRAIGISEHPNPEIAAIGASLEKELQLLCHMAKAPPEIKEWNAFYERLMSIFWLNDKRADEAGKLVRHMIREIDSLWTFLDAQGVEATNNRAERSLRFPVMYRKRSLGTRQECGERFIERILSLRQTCRIQAIRTFQVLVDAFRAWLQRAPPNLSVIPALTP